MIIWRGKGVTTFISLILAALLVLFLTETLAPSVFNETNAAMDAVQGTLVFGVAALFNFVTTFKIRFLRDAESRRYIDPETNEEIIIKNESSLFFIKRKYWTYIFLILGILWLIYGIIQLV